MNTRYLICNDEEILCKEFLNTNKSQSFIELWNEEDEKVGVLKNTTLPDSADEGEIEIFNQSVCNFLK